MEINRISEPVEVALLQGIKATGRIFMSNQQYQNKMNSSIINLLRSLIKSSITMKDNTSECVPIKLVSTLVTGNKSE